ncbi:MAG: hypothetical protein SFX73_37585 [Kofleriaceae bacterium]|nr:hypothetical protein [Kofleriaceae bacterium]
MRTVLALVAMSTVVAVTAADACPRGAQCITSRPQDLAINLAPQLEVPRARRLRLHLTADVGARKPVLAMTPAHEQKDPNAVEMPWIWQVIRGQFYKSMPTYQGDQDLTLRLAPVVVAGQFDTIPGVGVAGEF